MSPPAPLAAAGPRALPCGRALLPVRAEAPPPVDLHTCTSPTAYVDEVQRCRNWAEARLDGHLARLSSLLRRQQAVLAAVFAASKDDPQLKAVHHYDAVALRAQASRGALPGAGGSFAVPLPVPEQPVAAMSGMLVDILEHVCACHTLPLARGACVCMRVCVRVCVRSHNRRPAASEL